MKEIYGDKYQMFKMEQLMDLWAEQLDEKRFRLGEASITSLDKQCSYVQIPDGRKTAEQCIFQKTGSQATGMFHIDAGFYGLTTMSTDLLKIIG